jgi:hypothetical protein
VLKLFRDSSCYIVIFKFDVVNLQNGNRTNTSEWLASCILTGLLMVDVSQKSFIAFFPTFSVHEVTKFKIHQVPLDRAHRKSALFCKCTINNLPAVRYDYTAKHTDLAS